jgi:hypothetical protein
MLSVNVGVKSTSASLFGDIVVGPYLLPDRLAAQ